MSATGRWRCSVWRGVWVRAGAPGSRCCLKRGSAMGRSPSVWAGAGRRSGGSASGAGRARTALSGRGLGPMRRLGGRGARSWPQTPGWPGWCRTASKSACRPMPSRRSCASWATRCARRRSAGPAVRTAADPSLRRAPGPSCPGRGGGASRGDAALPGHMGHRPAGLLDDPDSPIAELPVKISSQSGHSPSL